MKFFNKSVFTGVLVAIILISVSDLSAQENDSDIWINKPLRKLGRGIVNTGFGALEIPIKIYDVNQDDGGLAAITYGLFKGLAFTIAREVVGVVETVTFLVPFPGCPDDPMDVGWGYGVIMEPEFVVDQDHNLFNIVYQDTPMMN